MIAAHRPGPFQERLLGGLCAWFTAELSGGRHVFMPRFEAGPALELIRAHRVTALIAVPAMVDDLFLCLRARAGPAACRLCRRFCCFPRRPQG